MQQNSERMKQMERLFPKVQVSGTVEVTEIEETIMKTNEVNKMKEQDQNLVNAISETLVDQKGEVVLPNDWSEEDQKMFDEIIKPNEGTTTEKSTIKKSTISGVAGIVLGTATNVFLGRTVLPTLVGIGFGAAGCYTASRFVVEEDNLKSNVAMFATGLGASLAGAAVVNMFTSSVEEADKLIEDHKEFFEEISEAPVVTDRTEVLEMIF